MKTFIRKIALFTLAWILIYLLFMMIIVIEAPDLSSYLNINYKKTGGFTYTRLQEAKKTANIDILFIGSSTAYRGFDPRIFRDAGYRTFNLGTSGQNPAQTNLLLQRYLDMLNPRLVVYTLLPGTFTKFGVESTTDLISNDKIDFETVKLAISSNSMHVYNTLIYGLMSQIFKVNHEPEISYGMGNDTYIKGGYVQNSSVNTYGPNETQPNEWKPENFQVQKFKKNIKLLNRKKIDYLLIQTPLNSDYYQNAFSNKEKVDEFFSNYGPYINYQGQISLNDSLHFYDNTVHLNQKGVEIFNKKILEREDFKISD